MTGFRWTEIFKCPKCGMRGQAELVEVSPFNNRFEHVPAGFRTVIGQYGAPELYCETCNIPVSTKVAKRQKGADAGGPLI